MYLRIFGCHFLHFYLNIVNNIDYVMTRVSLSGEISSGKTLIIGEAGNIVIIKLMFYQGWPTLSLGATPVT